jgi:mRNA-degrading endonuclease RelE of RelBE toxin-antitoxin system
LNWEVELDSQPRKFIERNGRENPDFNPTLSMLLDELEKDPKQYKKLGGKLAHLRAARLRWRAVPWRLVFTLDEAARVVTVIAIDKRADIY